MKNIFVTLALVFGSVLGLLAQDCATGYCPKTIRAHHVKGDVAPVDIDITYQVVSQSFTGREDYCLLAQNLGASQAATSVTDDSEAARGWYWQFGRRQGYLRITDSSFSPALPANWTTDYTANDNWVPLEDPCKLLLGNEWYIPFSSATEIENYGSTETAFDEGHFHYSGAISGTTSAIGNFGVRGYWWTTNSTAANLADFMMLKTTTTVADQSTTANNVKTAGLSVRCLRKKIPVAPNN